LTVNELSSEQTHATSATSNKVIKLINYCASHPEAELRYHASDMILNIHSDASYLSEREANSLSGGFFTWEATLPERTISAMDPF
jgi:hypothetical protein